MIKFNHFNFNVFDLQKSLDFYQEALNLTAVREKNASDGSFKLVYLGDGESDFQRPGRGLPRRGFHPFHA